MVGRTGDVAAELPRGPLEALAVPRNVVADAAGTPGKRGSAPDRRVCERLRDQPRGSDFRPIEARRARQQTFQLDVFLPIEFGNPRAVNTNPSTQARDQFRQTEIISGRDASHPGEKRLTGHRPGRER